VSGPEDFTVHATSGVVTWTPQSEGLVLLEVSAANLAGTDTQAFEVQVEGLQGPVFITEPATEATVAAEYAYDPAVVANGDVTWSAPGAPAGLTIDADTGAVRWTPTSSQAGMQPVTIRATENDGGLFADQEFTITVEDTGGPAVITSTPPSRGGANDPMDYRRSVVSGDAGFGRNHRDQPARRARGDGAVGHRDRRARRLPDRDSGRQWAR
jgi:hypothetical protein